MEPIILLRGMLVSDATNLSLYPKFAPFRVQNPGTGYVLVAITILVPVMSVSAVPNPRKQTFPRKQNVSFAWTNPRTFS